MAALTPIGIYDILDKLASTAGISRTDLSLDDELGEHLSDLELAEALPYLAAYHGYSSDALCAEINRESTIEDLYEWFMRQQDAAGLPAKAYEPAENLESLFAAHEKLIRFYRNPWHLRESIAILEAIRQLRQNEVDQKRAAYAKERRGCTVEATVLTLILMIPAAIFLGGLARKIILGLLALHLVLSVIFRIWGLNNADCKKREAEISQLQEKVQETETQLAALKAELQALS